MVHRWLIVLVVVSQGLLTVIKGGDPSTRVVLPQGTLTGVRMQTDRRVLVTAYLGIPYALPPIGRYRFAAPERHPGWNDSLVAEHFRPDCPQPREEAGDTKTTSEDCLYLNVFVPEAGSVKDFPVVVYIEGEDYVTGSPRSVEAQELAAEDVIVVTLSYRMNIFGFFCLGDANSRGNIGILDQYLALLWVRENIQYFGGKGDITLMGHGAGAMAVATHMTSPRTQGLFGKAIIMSGSIFSPTLQPSAVIAASRSMARSLGCATETLRSDTTEIILSCLRQKSADEVLRAFDNAHKNANWTSQLVPLADDFLSERMQYLKVSPQRALQRGEFLRIPIITGTVVNEGTVLVDRWKDLATQSDSSVKHFMNNTAIPNLLRARNLQVKPLSKLLEWKYIHNLPGSSLSQLVQLYTDAVYSSSHQEQLSHLVKSNQPVFVYRFSQNKDPDFSVAGHGALLPFIFGPLRLYQWQTKQGRSHQSSFAEERLSLRMKRFWTAFMRTGDPNPANANGTRIWPLYSANDDLILELYGDPITGRTMDIPTYNPDNSAAALWNNLLPLLSDDRLAEEAPLDVYIPQPGDCGPYRSAMFTTLFFLVLLIICLILALVLLRRYLTSSSRQRTKL